MSYVVRIRHNKTGTIRSRRCDLEWNDGSKYWWTEGNMGCDCNLDLEFRRAGGETPNLDEVSCSEGKFTALDATLEDGTVITFS